MAINPISIIHKFTFVNKFPKQRGFKNVAHTVSNYKMFRIRSKRFNLKGYDAQAKTNVFCQLILPCNNLVLTSYLSGFYLESWFSWWWVGVQKTLKKRRKVTEEKQWKAKRKKNEEYEESEITTIYIFGFKFYVAWKHHLKKSCLYHQILFTVFMRWRIFETQ